MEKKLPSVFANKIEKNLSNNDKVYYSESRNKEENKTEPTNGLNKFAHLSEKNVNQKINAIFNSPRYIYKADVVITTKDGKLNKRIIGQNVTHLITYENELIPITDIIDIDFAN